MKAAIRVVERRVMFDIDDVDYLVQYFSIDELKKEHHHADMERSVAIIFGEDKHESYWEVFREACDQVITIKETYYQSPNQTLS